MIGFSGIDAPSASQTRFMCHVFGNVPHLDMVCGEWRCVGEFQYGYGKTYQAAYRDWLWRAAQIRKWGNE